MQLYDDPSTVSQDPGVPAAGSNGPGYFTDGSPGQQAPTNIRGWWLNGIAKELVAVIVAGNLQPARATFTQLRDAIQAMIAKAIGQLPTSYPPTGEAGGVLSGNYPNPGFASGATLPPSGNAGGDLSGSYPNPSLAPVAGLTAGAPNLLTALQVDAKGRVTGYRTMTKVILTSGSSWTPPPGVTQVFAQLVGGGGGGAGSSSSKTGGGGGSGGYCEGIVGVTPGSAVQIAAGAGGAAGPASNDGGQGGTTTFGGLSATGGGAGTFTTATAGGAGGASTGGSLNLPGGFGTDGNASGLIFAGDGGASYFGGGGRGGNGGGVAGQAPGSGGGGAYGGGSGGAAGGAGAAGLIILTY